MDKLGSQKGVAHILVVLLLLTGIVAGVYLVQKTQIFKPKATVETVDLSLQPSEITANPDQETTLNVFANTHDFSVTAVELHISYDPNMLESVDIEAESALPVILAQRQHGSLEGDRSEITVTLGTNPEAPLRGNGAIARLSVTPTANFNSSTSIELTNDTKVTVLERDSFADKTLSHATLIASTSQPPATTNPTASPSPTSEPTPVPIACTGTAVLEFTPPSVVASDSVTPSVSGLSNCIGQTVNIYKCGLGVLPCIHSDNLVSSCTSTSTGCTGTAFTAPSSAGSYNYVSWIDKNGTGAIESGESSSDSLTVTSTPSPSPSPTPTLKATAIHRYWSLSDGDHFYTRLDQEYENYQYEGIAFRAFTPPCSSDTIPIYRSYNIINRDHLYSIYPSEGQNFGYSDEGIEFCAFSSQLSGSIPLYRMWNLGAGDHFYTTNPSEAESARRAGWTIESNNYFYVLP